MHNEIVETLTRELNRRIRVRMLFFGLALRAFAVPATAQDATKVGKIPADAEIIFASPLAGEKDATGVGIAEELYVSTAAGKDLTRITYSRYTHNHFEVSPDRTMIVANRFSKGDTDHDGKLTPRDFKELWIIDVTRSTEHKIAEGMNAGVGGVAWSPDNKYVYFSAPSDDGFDIFRVSPNGGKPEVLTRNLSKMLGAPDIKKYVSDVGSSPDGQWLAMVWSEDLSAFRNKRTRVVLFKLDGTEARIVTDGGTITAMPTGPFPNGDFDPDISQGNRFISFERNTNAAWTGSGVMRVNWDGTNVIDLSKPDGVPKRVSVDGIPNWSTACKVIYSVWESDGNIYPEIVNWDGSDRHRVPLPGRGHHVQWIPSGGGPRSSAC